MLNDIKIFPKILLSCLLIAIIPLAGFIYQIYQSESDRHTVVQQDISQFAYLVGSEVDHWVDKNLKTSRLLSSIDAFKNMNAPEQVPLLKAAQKNLEWVSLIFVVDTEGNAVARSDGKPLGNYSDREYFKQVMAGKEIGQQVLIGKLKPVPLHCFAIPIKPAENTTVGIIIQCSTLVSISDYITASRLGETGFAFLVDEKNRLIAHGSQASQLEGKLQDFSDHPALSLSNDQFETVRFEGKDRVLVSRTVGPDWRLIVQQNYKEAYKVYLQSKKNAIVLAVITIMITLLIAFLVSQSISSPLKELTSIFDNYSTGDAGESAVDDSHKSTLVKVFAKITRVFKQLVGR